MRGSSGNTPDKYSSLYITTGKKKGSNDDQNLFEYQNKDVNSNKFFFTMPDQSRQLAAIMFTDIVGYTSMMQRDEQSALNKIERHRKVLEDNTQKFHGKILQYYGDGSLSIFPSAYDAVECAMAIQRELKEGESVPLRIGIHLGDIIVRGDTIYGDGVNVAARIESLGIAGSILFSDTIYHLIKNQPDIFTRSLGKFRLKNVDHPVPVYALSTSEFPVPRADQLKGKSKIFSGGMAYLFVSLIVVVLALAAYLLYSIVFNRPEPVLEEKSIAVLPFENLSNDQDQEYFSDGITEDILNHLSKISDLKVKSRTSTEQYKERNLSIPEIGRELGVSTILEGSVRKSGNQVRIVAQLIDVRNDVHIWSETFDREITEIFKIQSEIAIEISNVLEAKLSQAEKRHIRRDSGTNITAYDYALRAREIWRNWNDEKDLENALQLLEQSIELDPDFAFGYYMIGNILHNGMRNYGVPTQLWINQALHMTEIAISLDSTLANAYLLRGSILNNQSGMEKAVIEDFKKAYDLDPGNPMVLSHLGNHYVHIGEYEKGASMIVKSLEVGYHKKSPEYHLSWGNIYRTIGEYEKAEDLFMLGRNLNPGWAMPYMNLGKLYFEWGKYDKAIQTYLTAFEITPQDQDLIDALAWSYLMKGNLDEAANYWSMYEDLESQFTDITQYIPFRHRLGYVYWQKGEKTVANTLFEEQMQLDLESQQGLRGYGAWSRGSYYWDLAAVNAFLGNREEAYAWLDSIESGGFIPLWYLENDPLFEPIRDDTRFREIMKRKKERRQEEMNAFKKVLNKNKNELPI